MTALFILVLLLFQIEKTEAVAKLSTDDSFSLSAISSGSVAISRMLRISQPINEIVALVVSLILILVWAWANDAFTAQAVISLFFGFVYIAIPAVLIAQMEDGAFGKFKKNLQNRAQMRLKKDT